MCQRCVGGHFACFMSWSLAVFCVVCCCLWITLLFDFVVLWIITCVQQAPEVMTQSGHGRKADIWSVGATVMQMRTAVPPWKAHKFDSIIQLMCHIAGDPTAIPMLPSENEKKKRETRTHTHTLEKSGEDEASRLCVQSFFLFNCLQLLGEGWVKMQSEWRLAREGKEVE